jgi:hypothetical protein
VKVGDFEKKRRVSSPPAAVDFKKNTSRHKGSRPQRTIATPAAVVAANVDTAAVTSTTATAA